LSKAKRDLEEKEAELVKRKEKQVAWLLADAAERNADADRREARAAGARPARGKGGGGAGAKAASGEDGEEAEA
jgi:hypothetical protein